MLDAGRGQESLSGAGISMQDANGKVFSKHLNRSYRVIFFGGTEVFRFNRRKQIGESEFNTERKQLSSQLTRKIRSHKDLQGINCKICSELDAGNAEHNREKENKSR